MTIKDIEQHYIVHKFKVVGQYCLYEKEAATTGRTQHKYLCLITKVGTKFKVQDNEPTSDIGLLISQVNAYVASLPYDSDYYNPDYIKGYGEYLIIYDYLRSLGFKQSMGGGYKGSLDVELKNENIFGGKNQISMSVGGLDPYNYEEEIDVVLYTGESRWITVKSDRNVENIKSAIDGILKPLLLTNSVSAIELADKLSIANVEMTDNLFSQGNIIQMKVDLKEKLQKIIDAL